MGASLADSDDNHRRAARLPALKSAKVHFGGSVVDCLVYDMSSEGARISTETPVQFPDEVTIELRSGALWSAVRRWQRGVEAGLEFGQFAGLNSEATQRALTVHAELRGSGTRTVLEHLDREGCFDSPAVREASKAFGEAYAKLDEALKQALQRQ